MTEILRHADTAADLAACFPVMREPRPRLTGAEEPAGRVARQARAGYRILVAWRDHEAVGLAGHRPQENLMRGPFCYVDDPVVRTDLRRSWLGARPLAAVGMEAKVEGPPCLVPNTDLSNVPGQRFYVRFGLLPAAPRFAMRLP